MGKTFLEKTISGMFSKKISPVLCREIACVKKTNRHSGSCAFIIDNVLSARLLASGFPDELEPSKLLPYGGLVMRFRASDVENVVHRFLKCVWYSCNPLTQPRYLSRV